MSFIARKIGAIVPYNGEKMRIAAIPDFDRLTLKNDQNAFFTISIDELLELQATSAPKQLKSDPIRSSKHARYLEAFRPVLSRSGRTRAKVKTAADKLGISISAAYEALKRYEDSGSTQNLPPPTRPGGRGKMRVSQDVAKIFSDESNKVRQNLTKTRAGFVAAVKKQLLAAKLTAAESTIRAAYDRISDFEIVRARRGLADAEREVDAKGGRHPDVHAPFELIQIDHWLVDVEILDDTRLHAIGRCWLTVAIDLFSRMIWGWHVGFDSPGTVPLGLCMINGLTSKRPYLKSLGLDYDMPMSGAPKEMRADNAKEFDGNTIRSGCDASNILLSWRPVRKPQYGQYIERYNGTLARALKEVPGATGSSPKERKELKPEKTAALTFSELSRLLCMKINAYHNDVHGGLGVTPLEKFKSYYFNADGTLKREPKTVLADTLPLRMPWFPVRKNSIRQTGFRVDYLDYYSSAIRTLVQRRKRYKGKKINVRQDPFDIRHIYVEDPISKTWVEARCSHTGAPEASLYQLKIARQIARQKKLQPTPANLFKFIREQDEFIDAAIKATKTARRRARQNKHHKTIRKNSPTAYANKSMAPAATGKLDSKPAKLDTKSILASITDKDIDECL